MKKKRTIVPSSKYEKSYKVPYCKKCKQDMKWEGALRFGLFIGGLIIYECEKCGKIKEVITKPTKYAKKKTKKEFMNERTRAR
jgi:RNase P subunit RPR2